jgi:hypothetical protein
MIHLARDYAPDTFLLKYCCDMKASILERRDLHKASGGVSSRLGPNSRRRNTLSSTNNRGETPQQTF